MTERWREECVVRLMAEAGLDAARAGDAAAVLLRMLDDHGVAQLLGAATGQPERGEFHAGTCTRCGTEATRSAQSRWRWTDGFGRDRCRASPDDCMCEVSEYAGGLLSPLLIPPVAEVRLTTIEADGEHHPDFQVPAGTCWETTFPEPVPLTGIKVTVHPLRWKQEHGSGGRDRDRAR